MQCKAREVNPSRKIIQQQKLEERERMMQEIAKARILNLLCSLCSISSVHFSSSRSLIILCFGIFFLCSYIFFSFTTIIL